MTLILTEAECLTLTVRASDDLYPLGPGRWRVGSRYPDRDRYDRWRARLAELGATMEAA